ncbi:MAG: S-layer homology domain-containing protein [Candidatus Altimarinota bacterium]
MLKKVVFTILVITLGTFIYLTYSQGTNAPVRELRTRVIAPTSTAPECRFSDTESELIGQFCQLGIINGYADGTFRPKASANRAEMLKITYQFFGQKQHIEDMEKMLMNNHLWPFKDTPPDFWAAPSIALAKISGDIKGYENGEYIGYQEAKRGEAWKMMVDAGSAADTRIHDLFEQIHSSMNDTNAWFDPYVIFAKQVGINLPGEDRPLWQIMDEAITREEIVEFLSKMVNSITLKPKETPAEGAKKNTTNVLVIRDLDLIEDITKLIEKVSITQVILPEIKLSETMILSEKDLSFIETIRSQAPTTQIFLAVGEQSIPFIVENATDVDMISGVIDTLSRLAEEQNIDGIATFFEGNREGLSSGEQFLVEIVDFEIKEAFKKAEKETISTNDEEHPLVNSKKTQIWHVMKPSVADPTTLAEGFEQL